MESQGLIEGLLGPLPQLIQVAPRPVLLARALSDSSELCDSKHRTEASLSLWTPDQWHLNLLGLLCYKCRLSHSTTDLLIQRFWQSQSSKTSGGA